MPSKTISAALAVAAFVIGFLATMIATWLFTRSQPAWGALNIAIAFVALLTFIAVRARHGET